MTLCIAAMCSHQGEATIVCCCDESSTRDNVTSESAYKMAWVGEVFNPHVNVMLAGRLTSAKELANACKPALLEYKSNDDEIAVTTLLTSLRRAVGTYRVTTNDNYLFGRYGFHYEDFLRHGKEWLSDLEYHHIWSELKSDELFNASLIVSSFTDNEGLIIEVTSDGQVTWVDHFAIQGTGARLANAFLQQREYLDYMSLTECLYRVTEAKQAAERAPYVGHETTVNVFTPTETYALANFESYARLLEDVRRVPENLPEPNLLQISHQCSG